MKPLLRAVSLCLLALSLARADWPQDASDLKADPKATFGQLENGHCGIDASLHMPQHAVLDGQSLWLDYDNDTGEWQCASDVADKYLPISCRTP